MYIHKPSGRVTAIPEFDDFADFNDSASMEAENVEMFPDEYIQINGMNSRELFNTMMDFAQDQEDMEITRKLVEALRKSDGINHFYDAIKRMPLVRKEWLTYKDEKMQLFIKNKLMRKRQLFN